MRVASFVNHLEFEFEGNINKSAICLGDVDNDGQNELIVGNESGVLAVFKGDNPQPVRVGTELGMVSAISVGDVFNTGLNVLVVVTGCGYCYIYDFEDDHLGDTSEKKLLQPVHAQRIPANAKVMLIGDVNGDGFSEMVLALTDRVVRTYRWINSGDIVGGKPYGKLIGLNKWELGDQIGSITFNKCKDGTPSLLVAQPGGTYFTLKVRVSQDSELDPFDEQSSELLTKMSLDYEPLASARLRNPNIHTEICGNIKLGKKRPSSYSSEGKINGISKGDATHPSTDGFEETLCEISKKSDSSQLKSSSNIDEFPYTKIYNVMPSIGSRSESDDCDTGLATSFALATLDGTLMLVHDGQIKCNLQVDHQLFAVCGLDVTEDGKDEVIACAWDGNTYIVCQNTDCVRFTFHEPVNAFTAGLYGLGGKQVPCLVYATFNNHIYLYHDITMSHVVTKSMVEVLKEEPKYKQLLDKLGVSANDAAKLTELNHFLLYGKL